jgi:serine/threonine-protein phosphatase 5
VESSYDGPTLPEGNAVTMDFVKAMMQRFKDQKLVAKRYIVSILQQVFLLLKEVPSLMRLSVPPSGVFTVCGDTHGQFYDVLHIFELNGLPSPENPYLFNGDFVDRGSFSFEVVMTLLTLKVACPEAIYLTRGNHESKNMNKIYGFEGEVKHKYDAGVMTMFSEVFCWLPLCATINDKVRLILLMSIVVTSSIRCQTLESVMAALVHNIKYE